MKDSRSKVKLIFIRGLPGSGKSYLAERLAERLGPAGTVLLDPDAVDQASKEYKTHIATQIKEGVEPALHLYRFSRAKAFDTLAAGKNVIWNQPFSSLEVFNKVTGRFKSFATERGIKLVIVVIEVNIDPKTARRRVEGRKASGGHGPSSGTFDRFVRDFFSFAGHGYQVILVSGEAPIEESLETITSQLT